MSTQKSQHPAQPRTAAGRRLLAGPNMRRALLSDILAIEAEAAAAAPTPAYAWHANGDLCGGEDCPVLDADGDHPAPTPAEPLDVLRMRAERVVASFDWSEGPLPILTDSPLAFGSAIKRLREALARSEPVSASSDADGLCQCGHTRAQHESRYDAPDHCTHRCVPPWMRSDQPGREALSNQHPAEAATPVPVSSSALEDWLLLLDWRAAANRKHPGVARHAASKDAEVSEALDVLQRVRRTWAGVQDQSEPDFVEAMSRVMQDVDRLLAAARPDTPASAEQPGLRELNESLERAARTARTAFLFQGDPEALALAGLIEKYLAAASPSPEPEEK